MITLEDGKKLVKYCREVIENKLSHKKIPILEGFSEKLGVFVTIYRKEMLRGCIGFPEPIYALNKGIKEAALAAAFQDPRFMEIKENEVPELQIEISILTKPKRIKVKNPKEYLEHIKIGEDGLIIKTGIRTGLLLPQVASEENWDPEEFLGQTCMKAGLDFTAWMDPKVEVMKFQAQIFKEETPAGKVIEVKF